MYIYIYVWPVYCTELENTSFFSKFNLFIVIIFGNIFDSSVKNNTWYMVQEGALKFSTIRSQTSGCVSSTTFDHCRDRLGFVCVHF